MAHSPSRSDDAQKSDIEKSGLEAEHHPNVADVAHLSAKERAAQFVPPTPQEERAVIRKLDLHIMPIVFVLYMLAVLDRSNLGNAKLAGMEDGQSSPSVEHSRICGY